MKTAIASIRTNMGAVTGRIKRMNGFWMDPIVAAADFLIRLEFLGPWLSNRDQNEEPPAAPFLCRSESLVQGKRLQGRLEPWEGQSMDITYLARRGKHQFPTRQRRTVYRATQARREKDQATMKSKPCMFSCSLSVNQISAPAMDLRFDFPQDSEVNHYLAFNVAVSGTEECFPALLGVSVRSSRAGVVNLVPHEVLHSGTVACLITEPEKLGDVFSATALRYRGEVTFALWRDKTYQSELARAAWREWEHEKCHHHEQIRFGSCYEAYLKSDPDMPLRNVDKPHWYADRMERR
jgi:hypothetical protein